MRNRIGARRATFNSATGRLTTVRQLRNPSPRNAASFASGRGSGS